MDPNDLPNLGSQEKEHPIKDIYDSIKGVREGSVGPFDYKVNRNNIRLETAYKDALIKALIGFDGDTKLSVSKPIFGGTLNIDASRQNGNNAYGLQFQKRF